MERKQKRILFDCDNTFGVKDCDVDDGLALLYLLGCPDAKIEGITSTYGNNCVDTVQQVNERMVQETGNNGVPVKKGGRRPGEWDSEASAFLADMASRYPGQLSLLATGSLTNLWGAFKMDPLFFRNIKEIVLMGGITSPLIFEKKEMAELNFSCDPQASFTVLAEGKNVSVVTGNNCLRALFTKEEYRKRFSAGNNPAGAYIMEKTDYWFGYNEDGYGIKGFYNWDVTAAVYLMRPGLFSDHEMDVSLREKDLEKGYLQVVPGEKGNSRFNLPELEQIRKFKDEIYEKWMSLEVAKG